MLATTFCTGNDRALPLKVEAIAIFPFPRKPRPGIMESITEYSFWARLREDTLETGW